MPKIFYTDHDIADMYARGVTSIDVHDGVVLTDLAVERAFKLGIKLNRVERGPAPSATFSPSVNTITVATLPTRPASDDTEQLVRKVRDAVLSRLNGQVDPALLEAVIRKVLAEMK